MDKIEYIESNLNQLIQYWFFRASSMGAVLFVVLAALDYISTPENFKTFLFYRIIIAVILLSIAFLTRIRRDRKYQYILLLFAITASAITIELMILQFGGYNSSYYVRSEEHTSELQSH